jgi:hypothetical protein
MVNVPVMTMLAAPLPTIEPTSPLETVEALAAPPLKRPTSEKARSMKTSPTLVICRIAPKTMNRKT